MREHYGKSSRRNPLETLLPHFFSRRGRVGCHSAKFHRENFACTEWLGRQKSSSVFVPIRSRPRLSVAMPSQSKFEHRTGDDRDTKGLSPIAFKLKTNGISYAAMAIRETTGLWPHSCFALQVGMQFEARILLGGEGIAGSESGQGRGFNITTSSVRCRVTVLMPSSPPGAGAACLRLL